MNLENLEARLKSLAKMDIIKPPVELIQSLPRKFEQKFPRSRALSFEYKKYIPGGHEHQNAIKWPFTITMDKGEGAFVWDVDGNDYVDFLMASGPIILGHNYPEVMEHVISIIREKGPALGVMSEQELLAAKEIVKHVDSVKQVRFYQSGTEVGMAAARLARCYTGKEYIIKAGGSYHGWSDQFVYDLHIPGTGALFSYGIPRGCYEKTLSFKPGDIRRLEKLLKRYNKPGKGGVAAVFLEGGGGDGMTHYVPREFYHAARELCDDHGALMVMDEVITGFRLAMGGAQEYFGINADLSMLGKIVGHQYPSAGALGGREDVMELLGAQAEEVDENGTSIKKSVMTAGTLAGTNITCAAACKAIQCIEKTDAINIAASVADKITAIMNDAFESHDLPFFAYNFKSIIHCATSGSSFYHVSLNLPDALEKIDACREVLGMYNAMLMMEGIQSLQAMRFYTSLAHDSPEVLEKVANAFNAFAANLASME